MSGWAAAAQIGLELANSAANIWASSKAHRRQIAWEREQYKNKYQWTVEDMRNAGLNPMLAIQNGANSAVGGHAPVYGGASLGDALPKAMQMSLMKEQATNAKEQNQLIRDQQDKTRADTEASKALAQVYTSSALQNMETVKKLQRENRFYDQNPNVYGVYKSNQALPYLGLGGIAGALGSVINDLSNSAKGVIKNKPGKKARYPVIQGDY